MPTLNSWVSVKTRASGADLLGQPTGAWSATVCEVWADIWHPSGRELITGAAEGAAVKASIRMQKRSDVLEGMRVYHGSVGYDIHAVLPDERDRQFMMLVCQRVVA